MELNAILPSDPAGEQTAVITAKLYRLLERQTLLYTMGESASVPVETAQAVMLSILFTLDMALGDQPEAGRLDRLEHGPLEPLFEKGRGRIKAAVADGRRLLATARLTAADAGSVSYRDTLRELGAFFDRYDMFFMAHDIPCMIDYPLGLPLPDRQGIAYIKAYLERLVAENRFCRRFALRDLLRLWHTAGDFRDLPLNLFEPVFIRALGRETAGAQPDTLDLDDTLCARLRERLTPWGAESAAVVLEAAGRLGEGDYLTAVARSLLPRLEAAAGSEAAWKTVWYGV